MSPGGGPGPAESATVVPVDDTEQAWDVIDGWIARFAPGSAGAQHPPAEPAAIAAAEREFGRAFPDDVRRSLRRHDGQPRYSTDLPWYPLLPLAEILETRRTVVELVEGEDLGRDDGDGDGWGWHEGWLPVAELDSDLLVVDLRPGPGHGRLGWCPRDDAVVFGEPAPTLGAHLARVAAALTSGGAVDDEVPYVTAGGFLSWGPAGLETDDEGEALHRVPAS